MNGSPVDLSSPAKRHAWVAEHGLPGWLLFQPGEMLAINAAHAQMRAELTKWRTRPRVSHRKT